MVRGVGMEDLMEGLPSTTLEGSLSDGEEERQEDGPQFPGFFG